MLKEFKEFAIKGNVIDMAVGIIIGAAFGTIVSSLVNDVLMPPLGLLIGNVDFSKIAIPLKEGVTMNIGVFINHVISFVLVAFAVFLLVRYINRLKKAPAPAVPDTKACPYCLSSIPIKATKCSHCTADLKESVTAGAR